MPIPRRYQPTGGTEPVTGLLTSASYLVNTNFYQHTTSVTTQIDSNNYYVDLGTAGTGSALMYSGIYTSATYATNPIGTYVAPRVTDGNGRILEGQELRDLNEYINSCKALDAEEAGCRARVLLLDYLDEQQRKDWDEKQHFEFEAHGRKWRIERGFPNGNIVELNDAGSGMYRYCLHPEEPFPNDDIALTQYLNILLMYEEFTKKANMSRYSGPQLHRRSIVDHGDHAHDATQGRGRALHLVAA